MNIISQMDGDFQVLVVEENRIDAAAAIAFKDTMKELTSDGTTAVVLDLTQVDFVDSSGLGAIVAAKKFLGSERPLHLAGLSPIVAKVFSLTRMERVFEIYPTAQDAVTRKVASRA